MNEAKRYYLPVVCTLFGAFLTYMVVRDLRTGEIWRGGSHDATITLASRAGEFYGMVVFLSTLALIFWGGTLWTLFLIFRRRTQ